MSIADFRREYNLTGLRRRDLDGDAIVQFRKWFDQATGARRSGRVRKFFIKLYKSLLMIRNPELLDMNAMTLATADRQGRPSVRIVLLKGLDERGFVFYTNYDSRKGRELAENPEAALVFYWPEQERQVCVAGQVAKLSASESAAYFRTRPRGSRIGAWASDQSGVVSNREELEEKWKGFEKQYPGDEVPCPPNWGGYVLGPSRVEFWQGRPNRLHDRFRYTRQPDGKWLIERLSP
jgi:pyridoxamine 5'-phosphate oxidase